MSNNINTIITEVLTEFAAEIKSKASKLLAAEDLGHITPQTEVVKTKTGGYVSFLLPGYTVFIEQGVKGTENIPNGTGDSPFQYQHLGVSKEMIGNIRQWAGRKGLSPKAKNSPLKNTNTRKKLKETTSNPETAMAFAIAKSVKKKGLSAKKVVENTLTDECLQALANTISQKIEKEVLVQIVQWAKV